MSQARILLGYNNFDELLESMYGKDPQDILRTLLKLCEFPNVEASLITAVNKFMQGSSLKISSANQLIENPKYIYFIALREKNGKCTIPFLDSKIFENPSFGYVGHILEIVSIICETLNPKKHSALSSKILIGLRAKAQTCLDQMFNIADQREYHRRITLWCATLCSALTKKYKNDSFEVENLHQVLLALIDATDKKSLKEPQHIDMISTDLQIEISKKKLSASDTALVNKLKQEGFLDYVLGKTFGEDALTETGKANFSKLVVPENNEEKEAPAVLYYGDEDPIDKRQQWMAHASLDLELMKSKLRFFEQSLPSHRDQLRALKEWIVHEQSSFLYGNPSIMGGMLLYIQRLEERIGSKGKEQTPPVAFAKTFLV